MNTRLKISRSAEAVEELLLDDELFDEDLEDDPLELEPDVLSILSKANTTSPKRPMNSGSFIKASLHIIATSSGGLRKPGPSPKLLIQRSGHSAQIAIRNAVRILSLMSSFSCLKEYFLPELSSFGRLTGQTEIMGRAEQCYRRSWDRF